MGKYSNVKSTQENDITECENSMVLAQIGKEDCVGFERGHGSSYRCCYLTRWRLEESQGNFDESNR